MAKRDNNQQVAGGPQQSGMLGPQQQQMGGPGTQARDAYAQMASPWMQAGKWSSMSGGGPATNAMANTDSAVTAAPMLQSPALNLDSTYTGGPMVSGAGQVSEQNLSVPGPNTSVSSPSLGGSANTTVPALSGSEADAVAWFDNYYANAPLDSMNYPVWPDPQDYPSIEGQQWGTPVGNNTPAYLYGVPAPTQQQMQDFVNNALPVPSVPGNDYGVAQKKALGYTPTPAQAQQGAIANFAAKQVANYLTDPLYTQVGPGGLTNGQMKIMSLQKGGLLPKDLFL